MEKFDDQGKLVGVSVGEQAALDQTAAFFEDLTAQLLALQGRARAAIREGLHLPQSKEQISLIQAEVHDVVHKAFLNDPDVLNKVFSYIMYLIDLLYIQKMIMEKRWTRGQDDHRKDS